MHGKFPKRCAPTSEQENTLRWTLELVFNEDNSKALGARALLKKRGS